MFTHERHQAIIELLERKQRLPVGELQRRLRVSPATLRRDLTELEAARKLVRVHGGAVHPKYFQGEPSFEQKVKQAVDAKRAIALAAAAMVEEGQTVLLDSGTTSLEVGHRLMSRSDITIITNSPLFGHAAREAAARIIWIGGEFRPVSGALVGPLALEWLSNLRADWAFVGASGLSAAEGASTTETSEAAVKQAMIRRASKPVLIADSSKWQQPSTVRFAAWSDFRYWICDPQLPDEAFAVAAQHGLEIRGTT